MSNKIIKLNRGDSYAFDIKILTKEDTFLTETDVIYFALLLPHQPFEKAFMINAYTLEDQDNEGKITIKIEPKDTKLLAPGVYYYTVKLQKGGILGDIYSATEVKTIIERTKFIVNE